jgi:hypothetical protein
MGILELLGGVILALLAALGIQYGRSKHKEVEQKQAELERTHYAMNELERVRQAEEAARATANKEYKAPIDTKTRKDFENN